MRVRARKIEWLIAVSILLVNPPAQGASRALDDLVAAVLRNGPDGRLPPHLSLVLGIGTGATPVAVKQAVLRERSEMRVFNVCVANHDDIVILRTDESEHNTKAFLLSRSGKLRSAVYYHAGEQPRRIPVTQAGAGAAAEVKFWTVPARLAPAP